LSTYTPKVRPQAWVLRLAGGVREGGERPVLFANRVQQHPLLVEDDAGRADDFRRGPRADENVVAAL
jgi:hypothetical protein